MVIINGDTGINKVQSGVVDGDDVAKQEATAYRDYLRDLPNQCDGKSLYELKAMLQSVEVS